MRDIWLTIGNAMVVAALVVMFVGVIFLCAWMYPPLHEVKKMDCSLAEFSPDVSLEVKKACRENRSKI